MALAGWTWNLMNLMALPLMLGTGVDYTLFIQLALRRHGGDLAAVRRSVGRALMLCGGTAMAGFGSLACSSNLGHGQPGQGVRGGHRRQHAHFGFSAARVVAAVKSKVQSPKSKVRNVPERMPAEHPPAQNCPRFIAPACGGSDLAVVRILPAGLVKGFAVMLAEFYWLFQRQRREVVVQNFLPVFAGDRAAAEKAARAAHRKFAAKLVDLWRVESGEPVRNWLTNPTANWKSSTPPGDADAARCSSRCISAIGSMAGCC